MFEDATGTLSEDVTSLDEQGKQNLIILCMAAANDVKSKKGKKSKTKKTTVKLIRRDGIDYKIVATNSNQSSIGSTVKVKIQLTGLDKKVINNLCQKHTDGKISINHIRDINKINSLDKVTELDYESQMNIVNSIIENRNVQNDINSSEAAIFLLKSGIENTNITDNWYRGILRAIQKLNLYTEIEKEILPTLSFEQISQLKTKIQELSFSLEKFNQMLDL